MKLKLRLVAPLALAALTLGGCRGTSPDANNATPTPTPGPKAAAALPDNGFKAQITVADPPARLRAGQKETLQLKIKNASDVQWYARGGELNTEPDNRFYLAAGNRWLKAEGEEMITNMDGRYGLPKDLAPGEEVDVPLQVTAPKAPGDYILEVDLIQEQVGWFLDKGSPTARVKVTVVR